MIALKSKTRIDCRNIQKTYHAIAINICERVVIVISDDGSKCSTQSGEIQNADKIITGEIAGNNGTNFQTILA